MDHSHRPQWIVAIDGAGLTLGPTDRATIVLGLGPLIAIELLVLCLAPWAVARLWRRWRVTAAAAR